MPSDITESQQFAKLRTSWSTVSDALPGITATVSAGVSAFKEDGDVFALLRSTLTVFQEFGPSAIQHLADPAKVEVAKYLGALEDALGGFEEAMEVYSTGNATGSILEVYTGLRIAVGQLLPEELTSDENFTVIVSIIDSTMGDLSAIVLRVKQQLLQARVCWKVYTNREKARPEICPSNHWFDGQHWCYPEGSKAHVQIKSRNGICARSKRGWFGSYVEMSECDVADLHQQWLFDNISGHVTTMHGRCLEAGVEGSKVRVVACKSSNSKQEWEFVESEGSIRTKGGLCLHASEYTRVGAKVLSQVCDIASENQQWLMFTGQTSLLDVTLARKTNTLALAATCNERTEFKEQVGSWCYKGCPAGTELAGTRCATMCSGEFPVSAPLICATSFRTLALALQAVASQTLTMHINARYIRSSTGLASGLHHTIDALVEMGLSLVYPPCAHLD